MQDKQTIEFLWEIYHIQPDYRLHSDYLAFEARDWPCKPHSDHAMTFLGHVKEPTKSLAIKRWIDKLA